MVWFGLGLNMFGDGGHKPHGTQKPGWGAGGWQRQEKQMSGAVSIKTLKKGLKNKGFCQSSPRAVPASRLEASATIALHSAFPLPSPSPAALEGSPAPPRALRPLGRCRRLHPPAEQTLPSVQFSTCEYCSQQLTLLKILPFYKRHV